ncbi:ice-binding family protein [Chloroflexota bacterium]
MEKKTRWLVISSLIVIAMWLVSCGAVGAEEEGKVTPTPAPTALPPNPTAPVLGEAGRFVILASQKITAGGVATVSGRYNLDGDVIIAGRVTAISNGNIGITDQPRTYYEGFTPGANPGQFIELTNGLSYARDDTDPALIPAGYASTIDFMDQVRTDLGAAYNFLAADPNPSAPTQVCPTELGEQTLTRGVYKTGADVIIKKGDLHLDAQGDPNSVWIFSIDGTFTPSATGGNIILDNGAQAKNVYWRTGGTTTIRAGSIFYGNMFAWSQIDVLGGDYWYGTDVTGRLFSVNEQVTLFYGTVTKAP